MSWSGSFNIEYKGKNVEKFEKLAKFIIPNFSERFEINGNKLEPQKSTSWYAADNDLEELLSHLEDGDELEVIIDGETHPIVSREEAEKANLYYHDLDEDYYDEEDDQERSDDVELDYEKLTLTNNKGKVKSENLFPDYDRYTIGGLGLVHDIFATLTAFNENYSIFKNITNKEYFLELMSNWKEVFEGDDEMLKIGCKVLQKVMKCVESLTKQEEIKDKEAKDYFNMLKLACKNPEAFSMYLSQFESLSKENDETELIGQDLIDRMEQKDILRLGGKKIISDLVKARGLEGAESLLRCLDCNIKPAQDEKDDYGWFTSKF